MNGALFAYDAVCVTILAFYTGKHSSIFIFLFLINIILCGIVYKKSGAFHLSLWTSLLFSILMLLSGEAASENIGASIVINNLSFFSVAFFGGMIGHQIHGLSETVGIKEKHIEHLTHFNDLIVENIGTGLLMIDEAGQITHVNPAVEKLLKLEGLKGENIYELSTRLEIGTRGGC